MSDQDRPIDILNPDRKPAIAEKRCTAAPFGCGKPVKDSDFTTEISKREFGISGLCQACQDVAFAPESGDDE